MKTRTIEEIMKQDKGEIQEIIETAKNNPIFQEIMENVKEQYFKEDKTHGILHNERVAIMACYLGTEEKLNENEMRNLLYAALYHDIGRKVIPARTRGIRRQHGFKSAEILEENASELLPKSSQKDIQTIKGLCIAHSIEDEEREEVLRENGINIDERTDKMINILKDADALDRVRLRYSALDINYLRTEKSKTMATIAKKLFYEYGKIERRLEKERNATEVTEETIEKAVKKANKPKKIKSSDVGKATIPLMVKGSRGSKITEDVATDYTKLLKEKDKKIEEITQADG